MISKEEVFSKTQTTNFFHVILRLSCRLIAREIKTKSHFSLSLTLSNTYKINTWNVMIKCKWSLKFLMIIIAQVKKLLVPTNQIINEKRSKPRNINYTI